MPSKSKISWCDYTWNPVWGCIFKCVYCYARKIAKRFGKTEQERNFELVERPEAWEMKFPDGSAVFVNSMSDVSAWKEEWNEKLNCIACCWKNSDSISLISLTKDYYFADYRFSGSEAKDYLGYTVTTNDDISRLRLCRQRLTDHQFINIEPLLEPLTQESIEYLATVPAIIIGAETGNRKGKASLLSSSIWIYEAIDSIYKYSLNKNINKPYMFIKEPAFNVIAENIYKDSIENLKHYRQLLWTTRKALV